RHRRNDVLANLAPVVRLRSMTGALCMIAGVANAQHTRVVTLGEAGGNPVATFLVRDSNVFIRAGGESVWLSPTINCMMVEGQPPAVTTHAQFQELVQRWVEQSKPMREKTQAPPGVATVLTQD